MKDIYGVGGFRNPTGKPLYSYRCSDENYERIKEALTEKSFDIGHGKRVPIFVQEAFCLYVAEWIRRNHRSGHVRWVDIKKSLGWPDITGATLRYLTEDGLKFWKRPLRTKGNKPAYLLTLILEGGLPLRMMENNKGQLVEYFKHVLSGIRKSTNAQIDSHEIAENYDEILPSSLRNEVVYALAGEFCKTLHDLASSVDVYRTDIVQRIKDVIPDWYKKLPVILDATEAEVLARAVFAIEDKSTGFRSTLKVHREWVKDDDEYWHCEVSYKLPLTIKHGALVQYFDLTLAEDSNLSRLILRGVSELDNKAIALLSRDIDDIWTIEKYPESREILTGKSALNQVSFELLDGHQLLGSYVSSGGIALSNDLPWVLDSITDDTNKLRFIGTGSLSTTSEKIYLAMPITNSFILLDNDGELGIPEIINGCDRYLLPIKGDYVVKLEDGLQCTIKTGQEVEIAPYYLFGRTAFKNVSCKYPIFTGHPIIFKINGSDYQRIAPQELYWRRLSGGVAKWYPISDSMPFGKIELRQMVNNEVLHSTRCIIFPQDSQIRLNPISESVGNIYFSGFDNVVIEDLHAGEYAELKTEEEIDCLVLNAKSKIEYHEPLKLRLSMEGMEPADLIIPFPAKGCRFVGNPEAIGKSLGVNQLYGVRAEGVQVEGEYSKFWVEIEQVNSKLLLPPTKSNLMKIKSPMNEESSENTKSFNLNTFQAPLKSMLSNLKPDESALLRVYAAGCNELTLNIGTYPHQIFMHDQYIRFSPELSVTVKSGVDFYAVNLINTEEEPKSLEMNELGQIGLTDCENITGAWLIYGQQHNNIVTNQLLHVANNNLIESLPLGKRAFLDEEAAKELICELKQSSASPLWFEFLDYLGQVERYHPRSFKVMELLAKEDTLLLTLLFHAFFRGVQEQVWQLENQLGFTWGGICIKTWQSTIAKFVEDCQVSLNMPGPMLLMMEPVVRSFAIRDWRCRTGFNCVIKYLAKISGKVLADIEMATVQQTEKAMQDLIRLVDGLSRLEGFPKKIYFSAFDSNKELKDAVTSSWQTQNFAKDVESPLNHILIWAALTLLEPTEAKKFKLLHPLLDLAYQQAPEHFGPLFNYFQNKLVK